jgi:Glycosyl transferase family 2
MKILQVRAVIDQLRRPIADATFAELRDHQQNENGLCLPFPHDFELLERYVRKRHLDVIIEIMGSAFKFSGRQRRLAAMAIGRLFDGKPLDESILRIDPDCFGQSLLRARFLGDPAKAGAEYVIGKEFDYLAQGVPRTPAMVLCHLANLLIPKTRTAAVVTSVRNEGPWILEWIAFYRALNFDNIIIFHNDSDDGSDALLRELYSAGLIHLIRNEVAPTVSPQKKAFNYSVHLLPIIHSHQWVCYFDADEFLWPLVPGIDTVEALIARILKESTTHGGLSAEEVSAILVHWRWFASSAQFEWSDGNVIERFLSSRPNAHVKAIARPEAIWSMDRLHCPTFSSSAKTVDSSGYRLMAVKEQIEPPRYENCQLNHYFAKSFEEFALKKARGRGATGVNAAQRDYANFSWGTEDVVAQQLPNEAVCARTRNLVRQYLSIPAVREHLTFILRTSRQRLADLDTQVNLRRVYSSVTGIRAGPPP